MGGSFYDGDEKKARDNNRKSKGIDPFQYNNKMASTPVSQREVNEKMNPRNVVRESRDSSAHPKSKAVMFALDITGSMSLVPRIVQQKLTTLMTLLIEKNYLKDPQILISAFADIRPPSYDPIPFQTGQFESGIEIDDDLSRLYISGNGGGQERECSHLPLYFAARQTSIDCFEKRGEKGYLFITTDEMPWNAAEKGEIEKICGHKIKKDIPVTELVKEASEKYHIFHIIPGGTMYWKNAEIVGTWRELLGADHVLELENPENISELVALAIGITEGTVTLEQGLKDVKKTVSEKDLNDLKKTLSVVKPGPKPKESNENSKKPKKPGKNKKDWSI